MHSSLCTRPVLLVHTAAVLLTLSVCVCPHAPIRTQGLMEFPELEETHSDHCIQLLAHHQHSLHTPDTHQHLHTRTAHSSTNQDTAARSSMHSPTRAHAAARALHTHSCSQMFQHGSEGRSLCTHLKAHTCALTAMAIPRRHCTCGCTHAHPATHCCAAPSPGCDVAENAQP